MASFPETETGADFGCAGLAALLPSHFPRESNSFFAEVTEGREMGFAISSAIIDKIRTSLLDVINAPSIACSKLLSRPSQSRNEPAFSVTAATGRTTSAIAVTALWEISRETTNVLSNCPSASAEISAGSTPPTTTASSPPSEFNAERIPDVDRPGSVGSESTPHAD